jgi:hypothetical protein
VQNCHFTGYLGVNAGKGRRMQFQGVREEGTEKNVHT